MTVVLGRFGLNMKCVEEDITGQVGEIIRVPEQYIQTGENHLPCAEETFAKEREYILCSTAFRGCLPKRRFLIPGHQIT